MLKIAHWLKTLAATLGRRGRRSTQVEAPIFIAPF
jgi:hypothetical protein